MTDERYKKIMSDLGMPNSRSLLSALQHVANEVAQERDKCSYMWPMRDAKSLLQALVDVQNTNGNIGLRTSRFND